MTFTMDRKDAILTVSDCVRKLQILEARGKIWSQELMMMVDDEAIRLIDYQTTVSRFALGDDAAHYVEQHIPIL